MSTCSLEQLNAGRCAPCEGGVAAMSPQEAEKQLAILDGWVLNDGGKSISKSWNCKNFVKSLAFCNRIGEVAEAEEHHPDLHLTAYRHVNVVITTHAIGGLSLNDFILAAKIDSLR
ncbi:MAG: 4a-hydroxytetrahydrobiopterin dehydratase [Pirellulaceae bacterium]|nr:4a-hydroxytetrahydrobiopterin dehydratase [Pirellulaceae bacterium]